MTSDRDKQAFVWIWLPDETEPVVAGWLEAEDGNILFNKAIHEHYPALHPCRI